MKTQTVSLALLALCLTLAALPSSAQSGDYDNGAVNGQVNARAINSGQAVTDSFYFLGSLSYITSVTFWVWLYPGDDLERVEVSIGRAPYGKDIYDALVQQVGQGNCFFNGLGYNVCQVYLYFFAYPPNETTVWLTLQNASGRGDNPVSWDQNGGVGCMSYGCPSLARQTPGPTATIPSETFTVDWRQVAPGTPRARR
jgi:hypothetical protein